MSEEISKYEFNKYEEAKKLLLIDYDMNKDKRYLVAISALEKQIPSKPIYYGKHFSTESILPKLWWVSCRKLESWYCLYL